MTSFKVKIYKTIDGKLLLWNKDVIWNLSTKDYFNSCSKISTCNISAKSLAVIKRIAGNSQSKVKLGTGLFDIRNNCQHTNQ